MHERLRIVGRADPDRSEIERTGDEEHEAEDAQFRDRVEARGEDLSHRIPRIALAPAYTGRKMAGRIASFWSNRCSTRIPSSVNSPRSPAIPKIKASS